MPNDTAFSYTEDLTVPQTPAGLGVIGVIVVVLLFWCVVGGLVGYAIGNGKGRGIEGFWLGLLLGVIGWIIAAVMNPSEQFEASRAASIAAAMQAGVPGNRDPGGPTRPCPWCAEPIRTQAKLCRFCGHDVEPIVETAQHQGALDDVRLEFPNQFPAAMSCLDHLPDVPAEPAIWLRELCKRVADGSSLEAAANRIPLDWTGTAAPPVPRVASLVQLGEPSAAGDFPAVAEAYPAFYDKARAALAGLPESPDQPEVWLRELCARLKAGSPAEAAAARIPLNLTKS